MVLLEGIAIGWLFILVGVILLIVEIHNPGFFAAVPGTVLIFMGLLLLIGVDIFSTGWGIALGILIAIGAALVTVWVYGRMTTDENPTTISRDSLVGKEGRVKVPVDATTLSGKVVIGSTEWSARSQNSQIPEGQKVRVVSSEGVHIVVEEVN
jgi:membrane-bound ClpP family serine protease